MLHSVALTDFRCFTAIVVEPAPEGTTVLTGPNGSGKTTVLEAVAYLGSGRSFRGAPRDALVRTGCDRAYIRGELVGGERRVTVELEIGRTGYPSRAQVNRQRASRAILAEAAPATIFSPEDLRIVQGGPAERRRFLDDAVIPVDRRAAAILEDLERALRQRGALLRQAAGRCTPDIERSLAVWDERLARAGTALAEARSRLVADLGPAVADAYHQVAGSAGGTVRLCYRPSWDGDYAVALAEARREDLRRATTTVGPHRDDLSIELDQRDVRFQCSQGEQRCVALGLRLGLHQLVARRTHHAPTLLLDDVFSELDPVRTEALVRALPPGQCLLSTALAVPAAMEVAAVLDIGSLAR